MATEEARAMLDALMGGDRNAPLPKGAALPGRRSSEATQLLLPGKRKKSCYDKDIDPLYTAWGVDVYELFVNTKSDLGANPYVVDEAAHEEFLKLPPHEQDRLGYHYFLFQKLSELVRQCDRTVSRNKEKLKQELNRKLSQRGGQDFVQDVDEAAVEQLARAMVAVEDMTADLHEKLLELEVIVVKEEDRKNKLEPLLEANRVKAEAKKEAEATDGSIEQEDDTPIDNPPLKQEDDIPGVKLELDVKHEDAAVDESKPHINGNEEMPVEDRSQLDALQLELGQLTLQKQRILFDIARIISMLAPQQDAVESQRRHLNYVKSDISTDKTVCEVSGNFMSSRDADERIAAHYAGKQYVGWKLVRDKLENMVKKYGRYGPPPPGRVGPADGPLPTSGGPPPPPGRGSFGGGRERDHGDGYRGGGDRAGGGRWERNGPGGGGSYQDRGRRDLGPPPPARGGGWRR
jgi:LUC7 N_terminus